MQHKDKPMSAVNTSPSSRASAQILEGYFCAKDGNRPHLIARVFTPDARLEINNASASITFPAVTQGMEDIADVLVRQFGRTYENIYSFYLSVYQPAPRATALVISIQAMQVLNETTDQPGYLFLGFLLVTLEKLNTETRCSAILKKSDLR
jgi:hypothetical protein